MHDKWWPFWSFHAHFGQIGAICNVCIRSKVFFKYLDKLIGIREGHSYETSFPQVIKRKNFMTSSSTWQQKEDEQQILNSNDMSETHGQKCLLAPKLPTKYLQLSKRIPDRSILFWIKPKFEWLILVNIELLLFSVAKQFQVRNLYKRRKSAKNLWWNFGLIKEIMDLSRILSCKYANDFQRCL